MTHEDDASSPVAWPPIVYGTSGLIAALLNWLLPFALLPAAVRAPLRVLGTVAILAGLALGAAAVFGFLRARTAIPPTQPTSAIVDDGVYRYTRNPMYLGLTVILIGIALAADSGWFLIAAPIAVAAVTKLAIEREERYLARRFGDAYLAYKARVRRWL